MAMTIEFLRDWHKRESKKSLGPEPWFRDNFHYEAAKLLEAHLTQPAQAVDVGSARLQARANEIEDAICRGQMDVYQVFTQMRQLVPRALSAEKAGWPKLHADARIGATVFRKGVSTELVVDRAIREQEWRLACPICGNGTANGKPCAYPRRTRRGKG